MFTWLKSKLVKTAGSPQEDFLTEEPFKFVGSAKFGQSPKISAENTFNMYMSDGFLVPYFGYQEINELDTFEGRGIYKSSLFNHIIQVSDNNVYTINSDLFVNKVGTLNTFTGDVFIAENNVGQIAICDQTSLWIFNWQTEDFSQVSLDFIPGYVSSHLGRFLASSKGTNQWRISDVGDGFSWPSGPQNVGALTTKADNVVAVLPIREQSNSVIVMGTICGEIWSAPPTPLQLFPYIKNPSFNMDYGLTNPATLGSMDGKLGWFGGNEDSAPVVLISVGGRPAPLSTDGLDYKFANLKNSSLCYGFFFKKNGHVFYQLTFPDPQDNFSTFYDFNKNAEGGFYMATDENMNHHIAKKAVFFNNTHFFVSFNNGNTYQMNSNSWNYNGNIIPRIRISHNLRTEKTNPFIVESITLLIEQGESPNSQRVDFAMSRDGGYTYGNFQSQELNPEGNRKNILTFYDNGEANDAVFQFRFYGDGPFRVGDGWLGYYS